MDESTTEHPAAASRRRFLGVGLPVAAAAIGMTALAVPTVTPPPVAAKTLKSLNDLRALPVPKTALPVNVLGCRIPGDGGGGVFFWDASYVPMHHALDDGGTFLLPHGRPLMGAGRWRRVFSGALNPKWFGAIGGDSGRTPQTDGLDITTAAWNRWPAWTSDTIYGPNNLGLTMKLPPFSNASSWDHIGIQLALFSAVGHGMGEVAIPAGIYQLSAPIYYVNGMRVTLNGAGIYQTVLTKTSGAFDGSSVLDLYRIGGVPTAIKNICFSGPHGGGTTKFTLIRQIDTNGVHLESCWLTTAQIGVDYSFNSGDSYVTNCTAEFCETVLNLRSGTDVVVEGCNFWQSAPNERYVGIRSAGDLYCSGTRFQGFRGQAIFSTAGVLQVVNNHFLGISGGNNAIYSDSPGAVISGNLIVGSTNDSLISVGSSSTVSGNYVEQQGNHACLNILQGSSRTSVTGNVFLCSASISSVDRGLVISVLQGANYTSGCSGCLVTNNICSLADGIIVNPATNHVTDNVMG